MIEFKNEAQRRTHEKVAQFWRELFGEVAYVNPSSPHMSVRFGSALVHLNINPWTEEDATGCIYSFLVSEAELAPDLLMHLLRLNDTMRFGGFGVDGEKKVFFSYTFTGNVIDKPTLRALVMAVAGTADDHDDKIVARWGGKRYID